MYTLLLNDPPPPPPENPGWMEDEQTLHVVPDPHGTTSAREGTGETCLPATDESASTTEQTASVLPSHKHWIMDYAERCLARLPTFHASCSKAEH